MPDAAPVPRTEDLSWTRHYGREVVQAHVRFRTTEDPDDKQRRLLKERWSFFFEELGPYVMAAVFVVTMSGCCFWVLISGSSTPDDEARAWPALFAILGGLVGFIIGKATSK